MDRRSSGRWGGFPEAAILAVVALIAGPAAAEQGWVRGEIHLNLRTGPGTEFRILGSLSTGDQTEILERADSWTRIRIGDDKEGWIPAGYLQPQPPPTLRVAQLEEVVTELRSRLESTSAETQQLRDENVALSASEGTRKDEIERLSLEVLKLSAGARWPEWITGAAILTVGMLLGAWFHRTATRRPSTRIRI